MRTNGRIRFMGSEFDCLTEQEAFDSILRWRDEPRRSRLLITMNVSNLMMMRRNPELREACSAAELHVADGVPIVWGAKLLGTPLPGRVCGCDLMGRLLEQGGPHGLRVFFLGAKEEVVCELVRRVERDHPGIVIAGYRNGYFSEDEQPQVIRQIRESQADVLLVGMPTPFKETWCHEHREALCTPVILGVGGSFDVHAGFVKRAPKWMQNIGLEWFWRLLMEPRKMWKRYLVSNVMFLFLYAKTFLASLFARRKRSPQPAPINGATPQAFPADEAALIHRRPAVPDLQDDDGLDPWLDAKTPVSVVVPCFNEEESIPRLAERLAWVERSLGDRYQFEFVLVDDGSTDATWPTLLEAFDSSPNYVLVRHRVNQGIAAAIMTGIRQASAEIVCSIDSDCSYDPDQLEDMIPRLIDGVDLVTASPYHPAGGVRNVPAWRLKLSQIASFLYRCALRHKLYCYTSCFRVYRRCAVVDIELKYSGFVGVAELLWRLDRQGSRIVECPAVLDVRRYGQSKMRMFAAIMGHLKLVGRALWDRTWSPATSSLRQTHGPRPGRPVPQDDPPSLPSIKEIEVLK